MRTMQQRTQVPGVTLAEITGVSTDGQPLVRFADRRALAALVAMAGAPPDWRACVGRQAVLAFVDGDAAQPVILGVVGSPAAAAASSAAASPEAMPRTLRIAAGEELVIECGKSKIWLRADGRVEIRGEHVISRSRGPNKVKGGSVHIN